MSPRTLEAIAATVAIPTDRGAPARAYVEVVHEPGRRLANGYPAGVGGRTRWRVYFGLDGGRLREPTDVLFDRGADARAVVRLLNGESGAARPASDTTTGIPVPAQAPTGPVLPPVRADAVGMPRRCLVCGRELPPGSRPQRRTCSHACRLTLARGRSGGDSGRPDENAPDVDADSGASAARHFRAAPGPSTAVAP